MGGIDGKADAPKRSKAHRRRDKKENTVTKEDGGYIYHSGHSIPKMSDSKTMKESWSSLKILSILLRTKLWSSFILKILKCSF